MPRTVSKNNLKIRAQRKEEEEEKANERYTYIELMTLFNFYNICR